MRERLNEILALHTGQPIEKIGKDTDRDYILEAEDAKEYGLVDHVSSTRRLALKQPLVSALGIHGVRGVHRTMVHLPVRPRSTWSPEPRPLNHMGHVRFERGR